MAVFAINLGFAFTVSILTYGRLLSKFKSLNALLFKNIEYSDSIFLNIIFEIIIDLLFDKFVIFIFLLGIFLLRATWNTSEFYLIPK